MPEKNRNFFYLPKQVQWVAFFRQHIAYEIDDHCHYFTKIRGKFSHAAIEHDLRN